MLLSFLFSSLPSHFLQGSFVFFFFGVVMLIASKTFHTLGRCSAIVRHHQPKDTVLYLESKLCEGKGYH